MAPVLTAGLDAGWPEPALRTVATVYNYSWPWSIALFLSLALLLFSDGRPVSPRWRWWVWLAILSSPLFAVSVGSEPGSFEGASTPGWCCLTTPTSPRCGRSRSCSDW